MAVQFHVQDPKRWRASVDKLDANARRLLDLAHERHVPMTPELAAQMDGGQKDLRVRIQDMARQVLEQPKVTMRGQGIRFEMLFDFAIAPLIRRAATDCGTAVLFGEAALLGISGAEMDKWASDMAARMDALLDDPDLMGRSFWNLVAFSLLSDSFARANRGLRASRQRAGHFALSQEPDPALADMLADVEPDFSHRSNRALKDRVTRRASWRRSGIKPKEGGIEGIRLSRSLDDIEDALPSERCLPREAILVKLAEDGFLVKHRPPFRQPKRDLLMIGMIGDETDGPGLGLAICAFADACVRLWTLLGASATPRADLVLVRNRLGFLRTACCRIDHLPKIPTRSTFDYDRASRLGLALNSNLIPDLLDQLPSRIDGDTRTKPDPEDCLNAALAAVAAAPDLSGRKATAQPVDTLTIDQYTSLAAINFGTGAKLAFDLDAAQTDDVAVALLNRLYLPPTVSSHGANVLCPEPGKLDQGYFWQTGGAEPDHIAWPPEDDTAAGRVLARLSLNVIDLALEALNHG